jgi:hypothetical protein
MLDTAFPRPPGDVGHAATWPFPVKYARVAGATARRIVGGDDEDLIDGFIAAGEALRVEGAIGLATSCGFLAARQPELAARSRLPIATSSLLQVPMIERCLPSGRRVGVITYDLDALTDRHFTAVGAAPDTPRVGLPKDGHFHQMIEGGAPYRRELLEPEVLASVRRLLAADGRIAALVFECTNLPPFAALVRRTFDLPVFDIVTMGTWFYQGLIERQFGNDAAGGNV